MQSRRTQLIALIATAVMTATVASCSSDDASSGAVDDAGSTTVPADAPVDGDGAESATDSDDSTIRETLDVPDDIPIGAYVSGIETAMDPDKVEVDGTVLHVYLDADNKKVPQGTECMILNSVLPPENSAVVHRGGDTIEC